MTGQIEHMKVKSKDAEIATICSIKKPDESQLASQLVSSMRMGSVSYFAQIILSASHIVVYRV